MEHQKDECSHRQAVASDLLMSWQAGAAITLKWQRPFTIFEEIPRMRFCPAGILALIVASAVTVYADARSEAKSQVSFGVAVAQRGLWREAIYRWEKAVELDPTYAAAYNDLAVGYEHEGQFEKAIEAYERALELEPNNTQIRQNYELFREINDRTGRAKEKPQP